MAYDSIYQYGKGSANDPLGLAMSLGGTLGAPMDLSGMEDTSLSVMPDIGQPNPIGMGNGFGLNLDTAKLGLAGLGTIGNLWAAFQASNLAKKNYKLTKRTTETNMANQIKSYNTTLEDRARARAAFEGQTAEQQQSYIDKNRLATYGR